MERINFSTNWNRKLNCEYYTTIRLFSSKYKVGNSYTIFQVEKYLHQAKAVHITVIKLADITDPMAYVDTGYNAEKTKAIFKKMYPAINFETQALALIVLQREINVQPAFPF